MGINYGSQTLRLTKSVGDLTYYERSGKTISRRKVLTNTSTTELQQLNRCIQGEIGHLCKRFLAPVQLGFQRPQRGLSAANMFVRLNRKAVTATKNEESLLYEATVDYSELQLSDGDLFLPEVTASIDAEQHCVTFKIAEALSVGRVYPDDVLIGVIYEKKFQICVVQELGKRSDVGDVPVTLSERLDMSALEVYAFALNQKRKDASRSVYLIT